MNKPNLGAHVSAAGGIYNVFANAERIGAQCIQIFGASPRIWRVKQHSEADVKKYFELQKSAKIDAVYLHAAYLANLASSEAAQRELSIGSLADHLAIAETLKARGLIFHLGSSAIPKDEAFVHTVNGMKKILEIVPGKSWLIMENSAGGGNKLGHDLAEIGLIIQAIGSDRVKVCLDTAHMFEAGLIDEYTPAKVKALFDEFDEKVGLKNLVALHINDSKTEFNSHHDRHENLGQGYIGLEGFKSLAKEKRLWDKDWMLEVPGMNDQGPDKENLDILKSCFE